MFFILLIRHSGIIIITPKVPKMIFAFEMTYNVYFDCRNGFLILKNVQKDMLHSYIRLKNEKDMPDFSK